MFKVTKWHLNPVNLVCLILLSIITVTVLTSSRVHSDMDTDGVVREYTPPDDAYGTHTLTYRDMKDYQIVITADQKYFVLYDYDRVVTAIPFNKTCNLSKAVLKDNE